MSGRAENGRSSSRPAGEPAAHTVGLVAAVRQAWRETMQARRWARDQGLSWPLRQFFRDRLRCLRHGHAEPRVAQRVTPRGKDSRLEVRLECSRCGEALDRKATVAQFPRPRDKEAWRR